MDLTHQGSILLEEDKVSSSQVTLNIIRPTEVKVPDNFWERKLGDYPTDFAHEDLKESFHMYMDIEDTSWFLHLVIEELETTSRFHVIDSKATYNVLLGRPWIHNYNVVPSILHQYMKYYKDVIKRRIKADENPFTIEESHFFVAKYYQRKNTNEPQPQEVPEMPKVTTIVHSTMDEEITEVLKGITLPLMEVEKVASITLKGFVTPVDGKR
ncbi:hypothetical protein LIER_22958 [Lithospermum erythrorhizon]|uniref:Uncharacterized protein n=1 Tax=Lithospermum erythrorhizon TaxID=34254 RepID=A0AAV3QYW3_LITER